ncbi:MAG TPA: hypothetical protein VL523_01020 [Terriglobia bacterium]|nr:hypothetical protein [Terriglobia bacterium]
MERMAAGYLMMGDGRPGGTSGSLAAAGRKLAETPQARAFP